MAGIDTKHRLNQAALEKQLKRLRGFPRFPEFAEELKRVVNRHAADDGHVERIVNEIVDTRKPDENGFVSCPTPSEMIDYCMAVPDHPSGLKAATEGCPLCSGTGFRSGVKYITRNGIHMRVEHSDVCPCRQPGRNL